MTTDSVGGVWTFSVDLAEELSRCGIAVALAVLGGVPSQAQETRALSIPNLSLYSSSFKLEWMEDPWSDVEASGRWLLQLEAEIAPDVVHLNSFGHGAMPWNAPKVLTAHSCVASWWSAVKGEELPAEWSRYTQLVRGSLSAADRIVAPSAAMLESLFHNYGLRRGQPPSEVIQNGSNQRRFRAEAKQPIVLAAGRLWDEGKNVATLAKVAGDLPWPVYLAGEMVENCPLENCTQLGNLPQEELASYYAIAGIFAHPARYEPFGLAVLEAAISRCALVLGDIPSLREVWDGAAIFVDPNDASSLSSAIRELIANTNFRERLGTLAFMRAQNYTTRRMAAAYLDTYRAVSQRRWACAS